MDYIRGILNHDNQVLETVYTRYAHRIQQHVLSNGGTVEDAKDVFHDALMVIYNKAQAPDFVLTSQFYTYLFGICRFIWDRKRRKKANQTVTIPEEAGLWVEEYSVIESLEQRERHKVFERALCRLEKTCQDILRLFFAEHSMEEIAQRLQLKNAHTVRTRKYRCQRKLEAIIKEDSAYAELKSQNKSTDA